jgi:hypothetical protein
MLASVKEFATIKHVLERNSELIRIKSNMKIKALDCKVISIMFNDILRHKTVLKIEDEDHIFIRRAINVKSESKIEKRKQKESL